MYESRYDTQLFAELYDVQPQAIVWMRPIRSENGQGITDFEYAYSNDEGLKFLNLTREQFSGLKLSNSPTLTDELRKKFIEDMTVVYNSGIESEITVFNTILNKYARVLRTKLRDGVLNVVQDITKENQVIAKLEKQTQQLEEQTRQLQEQKTLLDKILENSSNGISVSQVFRDETGKVVDALTILANDAAVKYIGFPKDIYLSKRATEIEPAVMGSPYYLACIRTLETGEPFVMQYFVEATGRWLELTVSKMDYNHLIQVFTDVTAIKEVQLQLEKAAATLKTVFDSAQTGMFTISPEYNEKNEIIDFSFVMVNSTVSAYVGQMPEALIGEPGSKWFPGYMTNGLFEMYKQSFETGEATRREIHYDADGTDYYLDLQSVKIDDHLLITLTDHTSLRKSQLELERTVQALERSNTNLEDFAHAASHDMKEPLRKILTVSEKLKKTLGPRMTETEAKLFERIEISAERMQLLVDDLLEFSHVSDQPKQLEAVDLNEKLQRVLSDLELPIEEKRAEIIIHPLPTLHANRRQIQQLFQNLISNSLKYSKQDVSPRITISARVIKGSDALVELPSEVLEKHFHLIEVDDNGIGFEQQYAEQIFKMFQRLHGKSKYSGTGVGLSIARKVVQNHNGYIWAESELNKGSTFKILLPL
jgi:signal transduction histidine kinase